jgi:ketosteroid isomerase-like protein
MNKPDIQDSAKNKEILLKGNAAIAEGNNEGFLLHCSEETIWRFVGEKTLKGKEAVRQWMATTYKEPPKVTVEHLIAEGNLLTAIGEVTMKNKEGNAERFSYCDVWKFNDGKIVELMAFVIKVEQNK